MRVSRGKLIFEGIEPYSDGLFLSVLFIAAIAFLLWVWISNWRDYRAAKER